MVAKKPVPPPDIDKAGPRSASGRAFAEFERQFTTRFAAAGATRASKLLKPEVFSTGSIALDYSLGIGGFPRGRLVAIQGSEDQGKSTLAMLAVASALRTYPEQIATWVDPEGTFDADWAATLGVDLDRLFIVPKPDTAEEAANAVTAAVRKGFSSIVVLDSVGAMLGRGEMEALAEEAKVALVARVMTRLSKEVCALGARNGTTTLAVNQVRAKISAKATAGTTATATAGTTATGGFCFGHMQTIRLKVRRGYDTDQVRKLQIDGDLLEVGFQSIASIAKNKCAPRGPEAEFWIFNRPTRQFGPAGIGLAEEALTFGERLGVVDRRGAWYVTPDGERHQGKAAAATHLRAHPEQVADIRARAIASLAHEPGQLPEGVDADDIVDADGVVEEVL